MAIERNTKGIQDALFREWETLKSGETTPQEARAVTGIANSLIASARLELEHARFVSKQRANEEKQAAGVLLGTESRKIASAE